MLLSHEPVYGCIFVIPLHEQPIYYSHAGMSCTHSNATELTKCTMGIAYLQQHPTCTKTTTVQQLSCMVGPQHDLQLVTSRAIIFPSTSEEDNVPNQSTAGHTSHRTLGTAHRYFLQLQTETVPQHPLRPVSWSLPQEGDTCQGCWWRNVSAPHLCLSGNVSATSGRYLQQ